MMYGYTIGDTLDCNLLNITIQYFSNGTGPKLDCSPRHHAVPPQEEADISNIESLQARRMQKTFKDSDSSFEPASQDYVCHPYCS